MIRIVSKKEGFRRCGIVHSSNPVDYPDDKFTEKQLIALKAEPMLVVVEIPGEPKEKKTDEDLSLLTVAQLTEEISKYQPTEMLKGIRKAELIDILKAHREAGQE